MSEFLRPVRRSALTLVVLIIAGLLVACGDNPTATSPAPTATVLVVATTASATTAAVAAATATAVAVPTTPAAAVTTVNPATTTAATTTAKPTLIVPSTVVASAQVQQTLDTIGQQTTKTRRLDFKSTVEKNFMTRDALAKYQLESFNEDNPPEEVAKSAKTLEVFGLVPKGFDLSKTYIDLLSEQVLGFYDPRTKKLYLIVDQDPNKVSPLVKYTASHELTHALQDQYYDLQKLRPARKPGATEWNDDQDYALTALLEGDAVNSQNLWLQAGNLSRQELSQMLTEVQGFNQDKINSAPLILKDTLNFPYEAGYNFMQGIYKKGGWDAVNKAFSDYTPRSTSQILHPEKYDKRVEPVKVELTSLTDTLGQGWKSVDINTMGELQARIWLNNGLSTEEASKAVSAWAGDRYQVLEDAQSRYGYVWRTQWESETEAANFSKAAVTNIAKTYSVTGEGGSGLKRSWNSADKDITLVQKANQVLIVALPKGGGVDKVTAKLGF